MENLAQRRSIAKAIGGPAGPVLGLCVYLLLLGSGLDHPARATAGVGTLMATWWMTEAIPLAATSLAPLVLFPLLHIRSMGDTASPYAHELIFLFMGGFILGLALERWGTHERIALGIVYAVGTSPRRIVAGFMIATAALSMFISNTATAIMLLPIGVSVAALVAREAGDSPEAKRHAGRFGTCLMLGIAYGASIGGVATINGTPPNGLLMAFLSDQLATDIGYAQWMRLGLPLTIVFLPLCWLYLVYIAFPVRLGPIPGGRAHIRETRQALGRASRAEWTVITIFGLTALSWILRKKLTGISLTMPGETLQSMALVRDAVAHLTGVEIRLTGEAFRPLGLVRDATIAMAGALALFIVPVAPRTPAIDWRAASRLPWGILLLFGGGLTLAGAVQATGLDQAIGGAIGALGQPPAWIVIFAVAILVVFLTELTSNTAVTGTLLPVLAAAAPGLGIDPVLLVLPVALAASFAFMLPVATPPNAIVFSSSHVTIGRMAGAGFGLNLLGAGVIGTMVIFGAERLLGLGSP